MTTLIGQEVHHLKISTDATKGNLKEVEKSIIKTLTIKPGRRSVVCTYAGDAVPKEQRVKARPSMAVIFYPNTAAKIMSLAIASLGDDGERAFDLQLRGAKTGTVGVRVTGVGLINELEAKVGIEIVPVGSAWTFSGVVDPA